MKEQFLLVLAVIVLAAVFIALQFWKPTQAAAPSGCEVIGNSGNVIISRCIDDQTGTVVFANSAGFMQVAP